MEIVKNIAAIVGCILSAITLITLCTKGGRNLINNIFSKNTKDIKDENAAQTKALQEMAATLDKLSKRFDVIEEVSRQQCRNTIKTIYYKYRHEKKIPLYERKTVDRTYQIYSEQLDGNSYATLLMEEIKKWEIDGVIHEQDLDDV